MTRTLKICQEVEVQINWEKIAAELKKEYNIETPEEDIEKFLIANEKDSVTVDIYEGELEETHTDDLSGEEEPVE